MQFHILNAMHGRRNAALACWVPCSCQPSHFLCEIHLFLQSCRHSARRCVLCTFRRHRRRFVLMFLVLAFVGDFLLLFLILLFIAFNVLSRRRHWRERGKANAVQTNRINLNVSYSFISLLGRAHFVFIYLALTLVSHDTVAWACLASNVALVQHSST